MYCDTFFNLSCRYCLIVVSVLICYAYVVYPIENKNQWFLLCTTKAKLKTLWNYFQMFLHGWNNKVERFNQRSSRLVPVVGVISQKLNVIPFSSVLFASIKKMKLSRFWIWPIKVLNLQIKILVVGGLKSGDYCLTINCFTHFRYMLCFLLY